MECATNLLVAKKPHKWKIRAGLLVLIVGVVKLQDAIRAALRDCDLKTSSVCHHAQEGLKSAIYVLAAGLLVFIYGYVKRFKSLRSSALQSL